MLSGPVQPSGLQDVASHSD